MQQASKEIESSKLVSFVRRLTECEKFPKINNLARIAESNLNFLELIIGAVSAIYHTGQHGLDMDEGIYAYLPGEFSREELMEFLDAVYKHGKTKSGRLKKYFS